MASEGLLAREGQVKWFKFNKPFITANYPSDSAFGSVLAGEWQAASRSHSISCGGNDGELHIGQLDNGVGNENNALPISGPGQGQDPDWGLVLELPNAAQGDGPRRLRQIQGPATFQGYFRVWNEGHDGGRVFPSNPHHVFEVHPAWGFSGGNIEFTDKTRIASMAGFHGYGASKFRPLMQSLLDEEWLQVYQDNDWVYVKLRESANFHQLPVIIRQVRRIEGGHAVLADLYSDASHQRLLYRNLRCITVSGSPIDRGLRRGQRTFLLGFFSVNLRKCLEAVQNARSEETAVIVPEALEFFVFGRARERAVSASDCTEEENGEN